MKNTMKKAVALVLVLAFVLSFAACGAKTPAGPVVDNTPRASLEVELDMDQYNDDSASIYDAVLGEFYSTYMESIDETDLATKYAMMAQAEAKLMEAALMVPLSSNGGNYAIGRVAPYSISPVLWGNDSYRYHNAIVTTEPIASELRAEMKANWAELKGTGTYEAWAKSFLTDNGYVLKDSYAIGYTSDPVTWDVLSTSRAADSEAIINTYDGLYEYDGENELQPALATGYEVSEDGTVYTFTLREATWVDSQGRKVADVVADDFVAGMQHMMDCMGGLEYLVCSPDAGGCGIVGATDYVNGATTDFTTVGVKALDDHTVQYTLEAECTYFPTMWGYGVFAPMSRTYYESQGGKFGADFDTTADDYTYGLTPDNIAYCGPYLVSANTAENSIVFTANPSYWNKDNINIKTLTWLYNDGSDPTKAYYDMQEGTIDGCGLNASALEVAKNDGWFDLYSYITANDATSFMGFYNVNRFAFTNVSDATTVISAQTVTDAERTNAALLNVHFRRALSMAFDRATYNAQTVGEELKLTSLRNCYTPGNFVTLPTECTVDINGTATTFAAGTYYGEVMQAQIDADGVVITVWDPQANDGVGSSDGFDGWYNVENAVAELDTAIAELAEAGIVVDAENPIYIDLPFYSASTAYTNRANAYKQSIESALGGKVIVNLNGCEEVMDWYYAGYYTDYGYEANYDMYDVSGWGPDYGDPTTYLNTFLPDYNGYMIKCLGIF